MLATGLAALSFHNPRAEREFELEEEFELTGAAAQSAFLQTQSRGADPPGMDCICESMKCNCLKPCACGEPTFNLETFSIEIDGGCYCNKLECDCQKRCSCYPPPDTLPPPPPFRRRARRRGRRRRRRRRSRRRRRTTRAGAPATMPASAAAGSRCRGRTATL